LQILELSIMPEGLEELRELAKLLCAHRLDSNGGFVPLTAEEQKTRWEQLRKR
jgi:hypothetical protein